MADRLGRSRHRIRWSAAGALVVVALACGATVGSGAAAAAGTDVSGQITVTPRPGSTVWVDGRPYAGTVVVAPDGPGVAVVDRVGFEDYLAGIAEMPSSWPTAALEAQAVAARTYALWTVLTHRPGAGGGQICATDSCQVYAGLAKTEGVDGSRWLAAVRATRGQILTWHGEVLETVYGSDPAPGNGMSMSQYGALARAEQGQSFTAILQGYYPGSRLTGLSAAQQPDSISVTLEAAVPQATLAATGPVELTGSDGRVLATTAGAATWTVHPASGRVEIDRGPGGPSGSVPASPDLHGPPGTARPATSPAAAPPSVAAAYRTPSGPETRWGLAAVVLLLGVVAATTRVTRTGGGVELAALAVGRPAGAHYRRAPARRGRTANG